MKVTPPSAFSYPKDIKGLSHWHRWVDAIMEGGKTSDGFDSAGPLTEAVQLGNVATRVARRPTNSQGTHVVGEKDANILEWDADNFRITNHAAANALLTKAYWTGWHVPRA